MLDQVATGQLYVLAGSAIGASHDQQGEQREDDFAIESTLSGAIVAAVADGVGGARLSHLASTIAVDHAATRTMKAISLHPDMEQTAWENYVRQLLSELGEALQEQAFKELLRDPGIARPTETSLSRLQHPTTTLAVFAATAIAATVKVAWFSVGDCEVALYDVARREMSWLTPMHERDGQLTKAIPGTDPEPVFFGLLEMGRGQCVLTMTDGMAAVISADDSYVHNAILKARRGESALHEVLAAIDMRVQAVHDDRTVAVVGSLDA